MTKLRIFVSVCFLLIAAGTATGAYAQAMEKVERSALPQKPDSSAVARDTALQAEDSILTQAPPADSSASDVPKGTIDRPAFSAARDSVIEDLENNIIHYFGDVTATYGDMQLTAYYMAYNTKLNTVFAKGYLDTISNTIEGKPTMTERSGSYEMEEIFYNFSTRKAKIKNMATQQKEGKLIGENLKMMPDQSINISGGKYTVCDAPHPHYYLRMTTAKVMTKPKQRVMFGPAYAVIEDVPLPIILPFGFVPEMPDRASGLLTPTFGEEAARGLYLKDFGYSFVIGDYLDLALTGDVYSYGSWAVRATSRYTKRYSFNGSLSVNYSNDVTGDRGSKNFSKSTNFGINWTHSQDAKARPGTSFNASVNFSTPSNSRYNSHSINESLQNQTSSSISYSKSWQRMSISINALHSQNSIDSSYNITLPNITFTVNRFYPFKRKVKVGKERFYEQFSLSYSTSFQNKISFKSSEFAMNRQFFDKMQNGMSHSFTIGLPNFTLLKYLQFTPSLSYGMNWFFREKYLEYNPETNKVDTKFTGAFSTFGATHNYGGGISMNTRIYGTFTPIRPGRLLAVRHIITPSIGFSGHPELGTAFNGYTSYQYTDTAGVSHVVDYNRYEGMLNSPPSRGKSASINFSINNNIEAKVRKNPKDLSEDERDDPKKNTEKIKLIDQLTIAGNYNFLADSLKLSDINFNASTTVFGKLGINANMQMSPYAVDEHGRVCNTFNIVKTGHIGRVTHAGATLSYAINGEGKFKGNDGHTKDAAGEDYMRVYYHPVTGEYIPGGWLYYLNPNTPWSLNFNYSYTYSRSYKETEGKLETVNTHNHILGVGGQFRLTKRLNFNINTGWDFNEMKLSTTQVNATYDLHCFAISVSWVPNGQWQSWSFRIAAKASALADLLQFRKSSSFWDN